MNDCKIPEKLLVLLAGQSNMDGRCNPANTKLHHRPIDFILVNSLHARNHYSLNAVIGL